jgi:hypothetical protein
VSYSEYKFFAVFLHVISFAFSPNSAHILPDASTLLDVDAKGLDSCHQTFANSIHVSLKDSGWLVVGPDEKLLLWIPPEYRKHLFWPQMKLVMGHHTIHLDFSNFAHGDHWYKCFNSSHDSDQYGKPPK